MRATFHTTSQLGAKQSLTREGFLVCADVPVARTGEMLYGPDELLVTPGPDGVVHVLREAEHVFDPIFMASLNGKPIVNDHPDEEVRPDNWRALAGGVMLNPRRGEGQLDDCIIADFLVTDASMIDEVRAGKREVSLGYDADYEEMAPGIARQMNMIGNHVALVAAGRCGPRCSIGDQRKEFSMATKDKKLGWLDRIRAALATKDEGAVKAALDAAEAEEKGTTDEEHQPDAVHVHVVSGDAAMEQRVAKVEDAVGRIETAVKALDAAMKDKRTIDAEESEEEKKKKETAAAADAEAEKEMEEETGQTKDRIRAFKDSAHFADTFQDVVAGAEILVPGIRIPTFDAAQAPAKTYETLCRTRRTALDLAYASPEGRSIIDEINRKPLTLDSMTCSAVRTLFNAAVGSKKVANAHTADDGAVAMTTAGMPVRGSVSSIADLNKLNAERWKS